MSMLDLLQDSGLSVQEELDDTSPIDNIPASDSELPEIGRNPGGLLGMLQAEELQPIADPFEQERDTALQFSTDVAQKLGYKGLAVASRLVGMEDWGKALEERADLQDKEIAEGGYKSEYEGSFTDQKTLKDKIGWAIEGTLENSVASGGALAGGLLAAVTAPISAPLAAGIAATTVVGSGVLGAGEIAIEMEDKKQEVNDAIAAGGGAIMGVLEKFGLAKMFPVGTLMKKTGTEVIAEAVEKGGAEAGKAVAKEIAKRTGAETAVEVAQEATIVGAATAVGAEYTMDELIDRAIDTAVLGSTMAAPFGVAGTVTDVQNLQTTEGQKSILAAQGDAAKGMEPATIEYLTETPEAAVQSIAGVKVQPEGWVSTRAPDAVTAADIPSVDFQSQVSNVMSAGTVDEAIQASQNIIDSNTMGKIPETPISLPGEAGAMRLGKISSIESRQAKNNFINEISSKIGISPVDFESVSPEVKKDAFNRQMYDMLDPSKFTKVLGGRASGAELVEPGVAEPGVALKQPTPIKPVPRAEVITEEQAAQFESQVRPAPTGYVPGAARAEQLEITPRSGGEILPVEQITPRPVSGAQPVSEEMAALVEGEIQRQQKFSAPKAGREFTQAKTPDVPAYKAPQAVSEVPVTPKGREKVYSTLEEAGTALETKKSANPNRAFEIRRTVDNEFLVRPKSDAQLRKGGLAIVKPKGKAKTRVKKEEGPKRPPKKGRLLKSLKQKRKLKDVKLRRPDEEGLQDVKDEALRQERGDELRQTRPDKEPVRAERGEKGIPQEVDELRRGRERPGKRREQEGVLSSIPAKTVDLEFKEAPKNDELSERIWKAERALEKKLGRSIVTRESRKIVREQTKLFEEEQKASISEKQAAKEAAAIKPDKLQSTGDSQYSIRTKPVKGMDKTEVSSSIRGSGFKDVVKKSGIEPRIVQSVSDLPGGPHPALTQGMVDNNGKVWMVADNISNGSEARSVFVHEAAGHNGVEVVERNLPQLIADIKNQAAKPGLVRRAWKKATKQNPGLVVSGDYTQLAKETMAIIVEQHPRNPISVAMSNIARSAARTIGLSNPTQRYVTRLAAKSLRAVQTGMVAGGGYSAYAGFNIPETMSKFKKFQWNWQDRFAVVKDMTKNIEAIKDETDIYAHLTGYHGAVADLYNNFKKDFRDPILKHLKESGNTFEEMNLFLRARTTAESNKKLRSVNEKLRDDPAPSGMSESEAAIILESNKGNKSFQEIGKLVDDMGNYHLDFLVANDLIAKSEADAMKATYQHYVPLFNENGDFRESDMTGGVGFSAGGGKVVKRRSGGGVVIEDVFSKFVEKIQQDLAMSQKNKSWKAFYQLVKDNPGQGWEINPLRTRMVFNSQGNAVEQKSSEVSKWDLQGRINGERVLIQMNKNNETMRAFVRAFNNMDPAKLTGFMKASQAFTQFLSRMATTYNPDFFLVNPIRDLGAAVINLKGGQLPEFKAFKAIGNSVSAARAMWRAERGKEGKSTKAKEWDKIVAEFKAAGGQTGWLEYTEDTSDVRKLMQKELNNMDRGIVNPIKLGKAVIRSMDNMNTALENGIRIETFRQAKKATGSTLQAMKIAKEVTVDFNKKGMKSQHANALYAFFNAGMQGVAMLSRNMGRPAFWKWIGGYMAVSSIMHTLAVMASPDKDEDEIPDYLQLPEYETARAWPMYIGDTRFDVPQPWGLGFFNDIAKVMTNAVLNNIGMNPTFNAAEESFKLVGKGFENFSPVSDGTLPQFFAPTLLDIPIRVVENKSWHGGELRRKGYGDKDIPAYQSKNSVPAVYKEISQGAHELFGGTPNYQGAMPKQISDFLAPEALEMYVSSVTAGVGKTAANITKMVEAGVGERELETKDIPIARRFVNIDKRKTTIRESYYKNREKVDNLSKKYEGAKGERDIQRSIKSDDPELFGMISEYKRTEKKLSRMRKRLRSLKKEGDPISIERQENRILDAQSRMNKKFNRKVYGLGV